MDEFLILLQAKLDEAKSKENINDDIVQKIQGKIEELQLQAAIDENSIKSIVQQMSKLGIQIGQDFGKAFNSGLQSTITTNVLNQINKISDSSTSTIVQNEKKKQEAYKATSDAVVYHAGVISKLNKAETNGRFYGSSRGTGYFGTGHYFVDSKTKHELDNNSSYSKLPYTSVDISKYDNLFKATTDKIAGKLHNFLENLTRFTQGSDRLNIEELFSQFKNVFTNTTMDIKDFGDKMEQLKSFMSNSSLDDRSDSVSTQFMKSLGYGGVDTRGTKYADTRYGTVIYDLKEESILQANITDELQKQGQMLDKINYEKGQVFDSSADARIQEQIDAQNRLLEVKEEFLKSFNTSTLDKTDSELTSARDRLSEINDIISNCQYNIENATAESKQFAKQMKSLGINMTDKEIEEHAKESTASYQERIEELSLERAELEKRIPILEENYNRESQLASEAYKQAEQIVEQRRLEAQQSSATADETIQNEEKKQQAIQETIQLKSKLTDFNSEKISNGIEAVNDDGIINLEKSADKIRETYSELGKVTTQIVANLDNGISQIKVKVESTDGELKRAYSFLMDLSEDGKSFVFNDESLKYSENVVRKLNEQKDATDQITQAEEKLANEMADVREKSEQVRQSEQKRQELAQNKVINKSLEDEYKQRQKLADKVHEIQLSMEGKNTKSKNYDYQIDTEIKKLKDLGFTDEEVTQKVKILTDAQAELKRVMNSSDFDSIVSKNKAIIESDKERTTALNQVRTAYGQLKNDASQYYNLNKQSKLTTDIQNWLSKNSRASKEAKESLNAYYRELSGGRVSVDRLNYIEKELKDIDATQRGLGKLGKNLKDQFKDAGASFTQWLSVSSGIMALVYQLQKIPKEVYEIDTAMNNLYKVTDETSSKYNKFLDSSSKSAHELGRSISSLVEQTANWAKLGFSLDEAEQLAKISSIYANVGEVDNDTAVSDMVTAMKAFNIEASDSITIVDKLNKLGNEYATSAAALGDGLSRSASAMATSGTDINKTLAMLTGGTEITQNASEFGNFLKIGSMRIRGMKGDLEELGEEVDETVDSISKVQTQILNRTGGKVNIFDDMGNFRDYYDIMEDISEIYNELSDPNKADLTEILFGKQRGNQGAALIQAFQSGQIQKALDATLHAEGSAIQEQERWLESLEAKTAQFEAAFQSLSSTVLDSNLLKWFVDFGTGTVKVIDTVIDKLGSLGTIGTIGGAIVGAKGQG